MIVRPFRLIGATKLAKLQQRLESRLLVWEQDWGANLPAHSLRVNRLEKQQIEWDKPLWRRIELSGAGEAWVRLPDGLPRYLHQLMFGEDRQASLQDRHLESTLALEIAEQASVALLNALVSAIGDDWCRTDTATTPASLPAHAVAPHAGTVVIEWPLSGKPLQLVASGLSNDPMPLPKHAEVKALKHALAPVRFSAQAMLGEVELTIGQLETLRVGDVLRLDTQLDQLQTLVGPSGMALCRGHIGSRLGHRAIEVIK